MLGNRGDKKGVIRRPVDSMPSHGSEVGTSQSGEEEICYIYVAMV
jgi:hypothetical protein